MYTLDVSIPTPISVTLHLMSEVSPSSIGSSILIHSISGPVVSLILICIVDEFEPVESCAITFIEYVPLIKCTVDHV